MLTSKYGMFAKVANHGCYGDKKHEGKFFWRLITESS